MILLAVAPSLAAVGAPFDCADGDLPIVGLPGLEVRCVYELPTDGSTWDRVLWTFGDGEVVEGDAVSHVYPEAGQYTVSAELDGWNPPPDAPPTEDVRDPYFAAHGLVTICGAPEPSFTIGALGGLDYQLVNESTIAVYCLTDLVWDVYRGVDTSQRPTLSFDVWAPLVTLPDAGTWTFLLTMGGIGGTEAAASTVDAAYGLPDGLNVPGTRDYDCATGPGVGGPVVLLGSLALIGLRRRRSVG